MAYKKYESEKFEHTCSFPTVIDDENAIQFKFFGSRKRGMLNYLQFARLKS